MDRKTGGLFTTFRLTTGSSFWACFLGVTGSLIVSHIIQSLGFSHCQRWSEKVTDSIFSNVMRMLKAQRTDDTSITLPDPRLPPRLK
jgi:hypothetical protein